MPATLTIPSRTTVPKPPPRRYIPREALAKILVAEIAKREGQSAQLGFPGVFRTGRSVLADELVASGCFTKDDSANRRLATILTGETQDKLGRQYIQETVEVELADKILTGIDRSDAWHNELEGLEFTRGDRQTSRLQRMGRSA